jgi:hypothetical protein
MLYREVDIDTAKHQDAISLLATNLDLASGVRTLRVTTSRDQLDEREPPFTLARALLNMVSLKSLNFRDIEKMFPSEKDKFVEVLFDRTRENLEELSFYGEVTRFFGDRYYHPAGVSARFPMLKRLEWGPSPPGGLGELFILISLLS